jgi:hypothetical protein
MSRNELPPLWSPPPPIGHNGGPPVDILPNAKPQRRPGRPTVSTPQLRDRIFELLLDGVPLRVMCRAEGMPSRATVYRWRKLDPAFDRKFEFYQEEGILRSWLSRKSTGCWSAVVPKWPGWFSIYADSNSLE